MGVASGPDFRSEQRGRCGGETGALRRVASELESNAERTVDKIDGDVKYCLLFTKFTYILRAPDGL